MGNFGEWELSLKSGSLIKGVWRRIVPRVDRPLVAGEAQEKWELANDKALGLIFGSLDGNNAQLIGDLADASAACRRLQLELYIKAIQHELVSVASSTSLISEWYLAKTSEASPLSSEDSVTMSFKLSTPI